MMKNIHIIRLHNSNVCQGLARDINPEVLYLAIQTTCETPTSHLHDITYRIGRADDLILN